MQGSLMAMDSIMINDPGANDKACSQKLHLNIIDKTLVRARNRGWARTTPVTQFGISTRNRRNPSKIWAFTSWSLAAESERQSLANHGNPLQSANWKLEYCRKQVEVGWSRFVLKLSSVCCNVFQTKWKFCPWRARAEMKISRDGVEDPLLYEIMYLNSRRTQTGTKLPVIDFK